MVLPPEVEEDSAEVVEVGRVRGSVDGMIGAGKVEETKRMRE
jgi:hypothetical protein